MTAICWVVRYHEEMWQIRQENTVTKGVAEREELKMIWH